MAEKEPKDRNDNKGGNKEDDVYDEASDKQDGKEDSHEDESHSSLESEDEVEMTQEELDAAVQRLQEQFRKKQEQKVAKAKAKKKDADERKVREGGPDRDRDLKQQKSHQQAAIDLAELVKQMAAQNRGPFEIPRTFKNFKGTETKAEAMKWLSKFKHFYEESSEMYTESKILKSFYHLFPEGSRAECAQRTRYCEL